MVLVIPKGEKMKKFLTSLLLLICFVVNLQAQITDTDLSTDDILSLSFVCGFLIIVIFLFFYFGRHDAKDFFRNKQKEQIQKEYERAKEQFNKQEHQKKMKQLCLECIDEINTKSTLLDMFPDLTKNICQAAKFYIEKKTKLKDFDLLNEKMVKGYIYDTLYEIPMQVIPKAEGLSGMLANNEIAAFCIECINLWQKEVPFVSDEKIKERKEKAKKKYGIEKDSFFNSIFDNGKDNQ